MTQNYATLLDTAFGEWELFQLTKENCRKSVPELEVDNMKWNSYDTEQEALDRKKALEEEGYIVTEPALAQVRTEYRWIVLAFSQADLRSPFTQRDESEDGKDM